MVTLNKKPCGYRVTSIKLRSVPIEKTLLLVHWNKLYAVFARLNKMPEQNIFQKALDIAIKSCGITATWLAKKANTSESNLSKFRLGTRDVYSDTLAKYFLSLPIEAKQRFLQEVLGESVQDRSRPLTEIIDRLDPDNPDDCKQAAAALRLIAIKFIPSDRAIEKTRENTEEPKQLALLESP